MVLEGVTLVIFVTWSTTYTIFRIFQKISEILVQKRKFNLYFFYKEMWNFLMVTWTQRENVPGAAEWQPIYGILISPTPGWPEIEFYIKLYRHCSALYIFIYLFLPLVLEPTTCLQNKNQEFGIYSNKISVFCQHSQKFWKIDIGILGT